MSSLRFKSIDNLSTAAEGKVAGSAKITAIFNENVFTLKTAREFLSDEAYKSLVNSIKTGQKIDRAVANQIAKWHPCMGREQRELLTLRTGFSHLQVLLLKSMILFLPLKSDGTPIEAI